MKRFACEKETLGKYKIETSNKTKCRKSLKKMFAVQISEDSYLSDEISDEISETIGFLFKC